MSLLDDLRNGYLTETSSWHVYCSFGMVLGSTEVFRSIAVKYSRVYQNPPVHMLIVDKDLCTGSHWGWWPLIIWNRKLEKQMKEGNMMIHWLVDYGKKWGQVIHNHVSLSVHQWSLQIPTIKQPVSSEMGQMAKWISCDLYFRVQLCLLW